VSLATLRCWTANNNTTCSSNNSENDADSGDSTSNQAPPASVLRPRAVLVACIYPDEGRLLGYDVNVADPGSRPTAPQTTACLLRLMLDPLFELNDGLEKLFFTTRGLEMPSFML